MNRGEVWWLEDPEAGRRPACVLTRQTAVPVLSSIVVAMATRTVRDIPSEVVLEIEDGMPERCALSLDNLRTVPKSYLSSRITRLSSRRIVEICVALRRATGC